MATRAQVKELKIARLKELATKYANYPKIGYPGGDYTFQGETRPARWLGSSWKEKLAYITRQPMPVKGIVVSKKTGNRSVGSYKGFVFTGVKTFAPDVAIDPASAFITKNKPIKQMYRKKFEPKESALYIVSTLTHIEPDPSTKDTVIKIKCNELDRQENDIVTALEEYMAKLPKNHSSIKLRLGGHGHTDGGNDFFLGPVGAKKILQAIVDKKNDNGEQQFTNITISDGSCMGKLAPHFKKALGSVKAKKNTTIGIRAANKTDLTLLSAYKQYEDYKKEDTKREFPIFTIVPSLITTSATGELLTRKLEVYNLCGDNIASTSPASQPTQKKARPLSATRHRVTNVI